MRCPRVRSHQPHTRAVRASCLPALRPVRGVRRWKWEGKPSHEAWPGSHQGTTHPLGRAVVERRQASAPASGGAAQAALSVARPVRRLRAGTDDSATAGVPLSFYLPEASRKELLRNILEWPALDWMAWVFSPIPVTASGGRKTNRLFDIAGLRTRAQIRAARRPGGVGCLKIESEGNRYGRSSGPWRRRARSKRSISRSNSTKACAPRASAASPFAGVASVASPTAPERCRSWVIQANPAGR